MEFIKTAWKWFMELSDIGKAGILVPTVFVGFILFFMSIYHISNIMPFELDNLRQIQREINSKEFDLAFADALSDGYVTHPEEADLLILEKQIEGKRLVEGTKKRR